MDLFQATDIRFAGATIPGPDPAQLRRYVREALR
jgi:hypothetical protein